MASAIQYAEFAMSALYLVLSSIGDPNSPSRSTTGSLVIIACIARRKVVTERHALFMIPVRVVAYVADHRKRRAAVIFNNHFVLQEMSIVQIYLRFHA